MNIQFATLLVQLPARMQAADVLALGEQLDARFAAILPGAPTPPVGCPIDVAVPATVSASHGRFVVTLTALREATAKRHDADSDQPDVEAQSSANRASDTAWRVIHRWLGAWANRAEDGAAPTAADAQRLFGRLFPKPEGLRFIARHPRRQWTSMQTRMDILAAPETTALVTALGGARLLARLTATHAAFGHVFAFTTAQSPSVAAAVVLPQFVAAKEALRDYVRKVAGSADPDIRDSEALAAWLLGPFRELVADFAAQPATRSKTPAPRAPVAPIT